MSAFGSATTSDHRLPGAMAGYGAPTEERQVFVDHVGRRRRFVRRLSFTLLVLSSAVAAVTLVHVLLVRLGDPGTAPSLAAGGGDAAASPDPFTVSPPRLALPAVALVLAVTAAAWVSAVVAVRRAGRDQRFADAQLRRKLDLYNSRALEEERRAQALVEVVHIPKAVVHDLHRRRSPYIPDLARARGGTARATAGPAAADDDGIVIDLRDRPRDPVPAAVLEHFDDDPMADSAAVSRVLDAWR